MRRDRSIQASSPNQRGRPSRPAQGTWDNRRKSPGQATVEFALASIMFLMLVFGIADFGRSIYIFATLHNAVREGGRVAKVDPTNTTAIRNEVLERAPATGLTGGQVSVGPCTGSCRTGDEITVTATYQFRAITQDLLGIGPINVTISATNQIE
jgi:Flp pilus assembly protein TadG